MSCMVKQFNLSDMTAFIMQIRL